MHSVKVLGASGSKMQSSGTTSFQVNENILIDAGNIISALGDDAILINHIFLTHSHFDHIADLAFLIDAFFGQKQETLCIYGSAKTIEALKKYIFNDEIWPDFTKINLPNNKPSLLLKEISIGEETRIDDFNIKAIFADHTQGSFGYQVTKNNISYVISGDTYINNDLMNFINNDERIKTLLIECSFPNNLNDLAKVSKHLTPSLLKSMVDKLNRNLNIFIYHSKIAYIDEIKKELKDCGILKSYDKILEDGDVVFINSDRAKANILDNAKFEKMLDINLELADEKDIDVMMQKILTYTREITHSDGGSLYLISNDKKYLEFKVIQNDSLDINLSQSMHDEMWQPIPLYLPDGSQNYNRISAIAALQNRIINIKDIYNSDEYNFEGAKAFDSKNGYKTLSMLVVPLTNHENEVIGVFQLVNKILHDNHPTVYNKTDEKVARIFSAQTGMVLTNAKLILSLDEFLNAFVSTIASAIDVKSKHTRKHIEKISKLAPMIARSIDADNGIYKDIKYTQNDIDEIEMAAKLHDIGKISMPETVMDKATKLQRVIDGIELIKDRMEILKRDREIEYLKGEITKEEFDVEISILKSELDFIQRVNRGSEFMRIEDTKKIILMSKYTYLRDGEPTHLLSEFERYNLLIEKGTLTKEEKDIMNSHAQLSINMLKDLPFPRKYQNVFHIAVNHHEKLNGKGYPRGLSESELVLEDRIMILADIFEALTSCLRPYKGAMKLSEAFEILDAMANRGEIDKKMLEFFKSSQALKDYVKEELDSSQIDEFKWEILKKFSFILAHH